MSDTNTPLPQDKALLTIDERILAIEAELPRKNMAGTTLSRCFAEKQGVQWVLALGSIQMPKTFFRGPTIEDVVSQGEKAIAEMKASGRRCLETGWDRPDYTLSEVLTVDESKSGGRPQRRESRSTSSWHKHVPAYAGTK